MENVHRAIKTAAPGAMERILFTPVLLLCPRRNCLHRVERQFRDALRGIPSGGGGPRHGCASLRESSGAPGARDCAARAVGTLRRHVVLTAVASSQDVAASRVFNCCCEQRRCGVTWFNCCASSKDVATSRCLTAVASSRDVRRHDLLTAVTSSRDIAASRRLNCCCEQQGRCASRGFNCCCEQQRRCGVTIFNCWCEQQERCGVATF